MIPVQGCHFDLQSHGFSQLIGTVFSVLLHTAFASSVSFTEATEAEENDCCGGKIEKPDTTRKA